MRRRKISKRAGRYISRKVKKLRHEGYPQRQSIAIAYAMARHHGYKVPRRNRKRG